MLLIINQEAPVDTGYPYFRYGIQIIYGYPGPSGWKNNGYDDLFDLAVKENREYRHKKKKLIKKIKRVIL